MNRAAVRREEATKLRSRRWSKSETRELIAQTRPRGTRLRFLMLHTIPKKDFTRLDRKSDFGKAAFIYLGGSLLKCPCGKESRFVNPYQGYAKFCSEKCSRTYGAGHTKQNRIYHPGLERIFVKRISADGLRFFHRVRKSKYWPDVVRHMRELGASSKQVLYHMFVDSTIGRCEECGDPTRLITLRGYNRFCCSDCGSSASKRIWANDPKRVARFKRRKAKTDLKKYGVRHHLLNPEIRTRAIANMARTLGSKKSIEVAGRTYTYSGYELFAIQDMLKRGKSFENDPRKLPQFKFRFQNRPKRYLPDFQAGNRIIEVKSTFTAGLEGRVHSFDLLVAKAAAVRKAGFKFECWIYNGSGRRLLRTALKNVTRENIRLRLGLD